MQLNQLICLFGYITMLSLMRSKLDFKDKLKKQMVLTVKSL